MIVQGESPDHEELVVLMDKPVKIRAFIVMPIAPFFVKGKRGFLLLFYLL